VIVVVGQPIYRSLEGSLAVGGLPARIALAAASHDRAVQLVGKAGEDPEGDAVVLALTRGRVGHVALLRDAGMSTPRLPEIIDSDTQSVGDAGQVATHAEALDSVVARGQALDAVDVELALRYLTTFSVIVLGEPADDEMLRVVTAATEWADAVPIVVVPPGMPAPGDLPADAIVFEAPDEDPDGAFAGMVGAFAAALDDGDDPAIAFRSTVEAEGWTQAPVD
jgi:hypothetical protein